MCGFNKHYYRKLTPLTLVKTIIPYIRQNTLLCFELFDFLFLFFIGVLCYWIVGRELIRVISLDKEFIPCIPESFV